MQPKKRRQQPAQPPMREFTVEVTHYIRRAYLTKCRARTPEKAQEIARMRFRETYPVKTYLYKNAKVLP